MKQIETTGVHLRSRCVASLDSDSAGGACEAYLVMDDSELASSQIVPKYYCNIRGRPEYSPKFLKRRAGPIYFLRIYSQFSLPPPILSAVSQY